MHTAAEVQAKIQIQADAARRETRHVAKIAITQAVRQGDVYIHRVEDAHPHGDQSASNQLAQGSSNGARHFADAPARCFAGTTPPPTCNPRVFLGPVIKSEKRFTVSHGEHAHISLPAGVYQVTHQMDAKTLQRVQD